MLLQVRDAEVGYGKKKIVRGVSLEVGEREVVSLIGHNGAGKSTLLSGIFGVLPIERGQVLWNGKTITNRGPSANLQGGISYCPQGAEVFRSLTVTENIELGAFALRDKRRVAENIRKAFEIFPALYDRRSFRAGLLSGGERQMLAIAMILVSSPRLAMLDEPSGGLAPIYVEKVFATIHQIVEQFDSSVLLVEQNLQQAFGVAHRAYVMTNGVITFVGTPEELEQGAKLHESYFSAAGGRQ